MSKNKLLFTLGLLIAVMPYLGFLPVWKTWFYTLAGLIIVAHTFFAYMQKRNHPHSDTHRRAEVFTESTKKASEI